MHDAFRRRQGQHHQADRRNEITSVSEATRVSRTSVLLPTPVSARQLMSDKSRRNNDSGESVPGGDMTRQASITAMEYWKDHAAEKNSVLVDVSDPSDFRRLHAAGSSLIALKDTLRVARQARAANMKLYMISRKGQ